MYIKSLASIPRIPLGVLLSPLHEKPSEGVSYKLSAGPAQLYEVTLLWSVIKTGSVVYNIHMCVNIGTQLSAIKP